MVGHMVRVAVIGHVEWAEFVRVPRLPRSGEIVHATETWQEVAGGGAVAAVQLRKLAGHASLFTALADDDLGQRSARELRRMGVEVHAAVRRGPQRRAIVHIVDTGERTITVLGDRIGPRRRDPLPWAELAGFDAVYFTAGDAGALRAGRRARVLTATPRAMATLAASGIRLDALIGSGTDPAERVDPEALRSPPYLRVATEGDRGGRWVAADGREGRFPPAPPPGPVVDAYGCGDSFAAGLTFGLATEGNREGSLGVAARCGAACLTGRGPYRGQLRRSRADRRPPAIGSAGSS